MDSEACVRCGRELKTAKTINQTGDPALAVYLSLVTCGLRPRIRTQYQRGLFCTPCGVAVAFSPAPEGEFNSKIYAMLKEALRLDTEGKIVECATTIFLYPEAKLKLMPGSKPDINLTVPVLKQPLLVG